MTETKINLSEKGNKCRICTGCGRCFSERKLHVVSEFVYPEDTVEGSKPLAKLPPYLLVVDIGTTTIAMQLRRVKQGEVLGSFLRENPQRLYGADVISRIEAARDAASRNAMRESVMTVLQQGINSLLNPEKNPEKRVVSENVPVKKEEPQDMPDKTNCKLVIAANTTMVHLLMGYDTGGLGQYPFSAERLDEIQTFLFGMETLILPGVSAFIGGDITAGIAALCMHKRKEITLFLDLGTNGEIVLGNKDRLLATSTAAGPAFEGGADAYGADLVALVSRLLQEGIVDETGLLAEPYFENGITIGGVCITQTYLRSLQMAKAAVCTGICIAAEKYGLTDLGEIDKVFLAGGLGYYINPRAAAEVGLIPAILADKTVAVGNAALEGAFCYQTAGMKGIADLCELFNLAEEDAFAEKYIENMSFVPYEDKT